MLRTSFLRAPSPEPVPTGIPNPQLNAPPSAAAAAAPAAAPAPVLAELEPPLPAAGAHHRQNAQAGPLILG